MMTMAAAHGDPHVQMHKFDEEFIAQVCHAAIRKFRELAGESAVPDWPDLTDVQRSAARESVRMATGGALPATWCGERWTPGEGQLFYTIVVSLSGVAS